MIVPEEIPLTLEYKRRYNKIHYFPLKMFGYWRLDFKNEQFNEKTKCASLYNIFLSFFFNLSTIYILYIAGVLEKTLLTTEIIVIIGLTVVYNCFLFNYAVMNNRSSLNIIHLFIKIDTFLNFKETKFMRDIQERIFAFLVTMTALIELIIVVVVAILTKYSILLTLALEVYFVGLYSIFYEIVFMMQYGPFLAQRVRYLNMILMKLADIDEKYLANILSEKNWGPLTYCKMVVNFGESIKHNAIPEAFTMIFDLLQEIENNSRFVILLSVTSITCVTFATVQIQITMFKSEGLNILRIGVAATWVMICWVFLYFWTHRTTNMLIGQVHQTKTICCYMLLNPSNSDDPSRTVLNIWMKDNVVHLAKSVIRTIEVRDSTIYIYGLFSFDSRFLVSLISAIFLYITILLQFEFPVDIKEQFNQNFNNKTEF